MSSLEEKGIEKEMEKLKDVCIGDRNGNNHRNWCSDLPVDALLLIMSKIGAIYILMGAQWVCKNWRKVCSEVPSLWRNIDMTSLAGDNNGMDLNSMAREAIDRAQREVHQFDICYFGDDSLLQYLADSTSLLRRLRLISAYDIGEEGLAESVCRFPLLEEIDITFGSYGDEVFKLVGTACPHLKCFRYNQEGCRGYDFYESNEERNVQALGIANYMPNLCQLQIVGNSITNIGLMEILDKCVHLESLDIRCCFRINMDATLRAKCARIKYLRLPNDPTDDYGFQAEADMNGIANPDDDDDGGGDFDHYGYSEIDMMMYDDMDDMFFDDYTDPYSSHYMGDFM